VDGYAEQYLLEHLEYFNRGTEQQARVRRRLGLDAVDAVSVGDADEGLERSLAEALHDATPEEARQLVAAMLDQMGFDLSGSTRTPDEILDRVLVKARRRAARQGGQWREHLERALTFVERLGEIHGEPAQVLAATESLLRQYQVPLETLDEMRGVIRALHAFDLDGVRVQLAPAMARGIAYYSGLIFELYAPVPDGVGLQICGGGRYDGLAQALTGVPCPAIGFAFGVERLIHALPPHLPPATFAPRVLIAVLQADWQLGAPAVATSLRQHSVACAIQETDRSLPRALDQARRAGYAALIALPGAGGAITMHVLDHAAIDAATHAALDAAVRGAAPPAQTAPLCQARTGGDPQ
jgi:histidyl-tRNA synthetase